MARMRQGQDVGEPVTIPSMPHIRVALVPLTEGESQAGIVLAAQLDVMDNSAGFHARNRIALQSDIFHAAREMGDLSIKVFESMDEMIGLLDGSDIDVLADNLAVLMDYASPSVDGLSNEDLDALKKAFGETDWSALSGRQWAALKLACQALFPDLLRARSLGTSSIDSVTETSDRDESTSGVTQS